MRIMTDGGKPHPPRSLVAAIGRVLLTAAALLLVPAVAMLVTSEMQWGPQDFVLAFALLAGTGLLYVGAARLLPTRGQRVAAGALLALALLLLWMEIAVGIVGSPISGS
jgi:hypothetical protein